MKGLRNDGFSLVSAKLQMEGEEGGGGGGKLYRESNENQMRRENVSLF